MKLPWDPKANSTIISDVSCIRPFAKGLLSEQWEAVTHEAEIEAMAHLFSAVSKDKKHLSVLFDPTDYATTALTTTTKLNSVLHQVVRSAIIDITRNKLIIKTPISWVLFRKVLQALEENIVSLSLAMEVGRACNIPLEDVPQVLLFYHDLGSVLYYPQLEGLREKVTVDPKFFIDALGKIFTFQASTTHVREWEIFHQYGILTQPLYTSVWKECGDLKPEDFIEVLLHFRLAAQVEEDQICSSRYKQYFIPAILKLCQDSTIATHSKKLETASPLHIRFETGFVPPGFFTRFVAVLAAHPSTTLYLEEGVYRNRVTFRYQEERNRSIEHLTVTDQHDAIQINVHRATSRSDPVPLANVCQVILVLFEDSAKEVENILRNCIGRGFEELPKYSVSRSLHYVCDGCDPVSSKLHYLTPAKYQTSDLEVTCKVNRTYRPLTEKEKIWFTEKVSLKEEDQLHKAIIPDSVSFTTQKSDQTSRKKPIGIFDSHLPELCDAMATDHVIIRAPMYFINDISKPVFDKVRTPAIPPYERAQAFLMELRRHLEASSDQRHYHLN
uniref:COR domain-containing protein n=1 Tax=Amphimedon queenslandica TaxID=400682 RepID=A0A1X7TJ13_AMPQE